VVPYAGIPEPTRAIARARPHLTLHNLHHNAAPTAELALALLLAAAKRLVPLDRDLRTGDWSARFETPAAIGLDGRRALVLGWGAIGRRVGRALRGLGVEVRALRRRGGQTIEHGVTIHPSTALHEQLPGTDFVVVTLPLTAATEGMIGANELALLEPDAVLVNVGRGPIVGEQALFDALRDGTIGAAGLDVWYRYPSGEHERSRTMPATRAFHELDNVVLSPHRGGDVRETERLRMEHLADLLNRAGAGEPIPNRIDVDEGY